MRTTVTIDDVLNLLSNLRRFPNVTHDELLHLTAAQHLWGKGLSAVDAHLLGSVALVDGARAWTRDKTLMAACRAADVPILDP